MSQPLNVRVVEPEADWPRLIGNFVFGIGWLFLIAWLAVMLIPAIFDWHLSYWQCVGFIVLLRLITPRASSFRYHTKK